MKKLKFETKGVDGSVLELEVKLPSAFQKNEARTVHAKTWREASSKGVILRDELDTILRDRGQWGDAQQKEYDDLGKEIQEKVVSLQKGGLAGLTKKTGKALALEIAGLRLKRSNVISKRNALDVHTAESIADQAQFNYLVSACTVNGSGPHAGKPYFSSYDNFTENSDTDAAYDASVKFYELRDSQETKVSDDEVKDFPEIKFLKDNGFANSDGQLIDSEGRLIDEEGRLINAEGRYVDESGSFVDVYGNPVSDSGELIIESAPLLDDE